MAFCLSGIGEGSARQRMDDQRPDFLHLTLARSGPSKVGYLIIATSDQETNSSFKQLNSLSISQLLIRIEKLLKIFQINFFSAININKSRSALDILNLCKGPHQFNDGLPPAKAERLAKKVPRFY